LKRESAGLYDVQLGSFIDGAWHYRAHRDVRPVIDPSSEEILGELPIATDEDLDAALAAAEKGFRLWSATSAWDREVVLKRAAKNIAERKERLALLLSLENGKPLGDARVELDRTVETINWCAEEGKRTYGRVWPPRSAGGVQVTLKRPIGPVAAFSPWNFPAVLSMRKIAAALAAGCSIIIKPAEETPAIGVELVKAFDDAGLPPGVLNLVYGLPAHISERLIGSRQIAKVSFTGSVLGARRQEAVRARRS
jgi:succinate-semialdehyde dehydrogenase / glutarate-semialdehyde dehydrogenase